MEDTLYGGDTPSYLFELQEGLKNIETDLRKEFLKKSLFLKEELFKIKLEYLSDKIKILGASVRGKSHIKNGTNRDDALRYFLEDDFLIAVVSDGAGSHPLSKIGSDISVSKITNVLFEEKENIRKIISSDSEIEKNEDINIITSDSCNETMEEPIFIPSVYIEEKKDKLKLLLKDSFRKVHQKLLEESERFSLTVRDLSCTLLVFLFDLKTGWSLVGQIGDGLITGMDKNDIAMPIVEPFESEPGYTYFITMKNYEDFLSLRVLSKEETSNYKTFFLMTDGVSDDVSYPPPENILSKWSQAMDKNLRSEEDISEISKNLMEWLDNYKAKGSFDDRTLMAILKLD